MKNTPGKKLKRLNIRIVVTLCILLASFNAFSIVARSQGAPPLLPVPCASCASTVYPSELLTNWPRTVQVLTNLVTQEFNALQNWYVTDFYQNKWLPAFKEMSGQLSAVSMQQAQMIGMFLDAKNQLETQQLLQKMSARAHKDYHPSVGLCEFGSGTKSLAASERLGEYNALILARRSQDRALGATNTLAAAGSATDKGQRFERFKKKFCDPNDNNGGLKSVCDADSTKTIAGQDSKINKDIDYVRTIDTPWTLNVDFTDNKIEGTDEEEILALASNLYGHDVFNRPTINADSKNLQKNYLDMRAFLAKRNVAENSYNAIAGMKSAGTAGSKDYLKALLQDLGVKDADATKMLGDRPSYYAQMEVLTKKIYQNPDFYTNLYDTPANVARKGVALQALNLMQKFDLFKSYLRNEASLSVLLELTLINMQDQIENKSQNK